jgi:hypothetical protein
MTTRGGGKKRKPRLAVERAVFIRQHGVVTVEPHPATSSRYMGHNRRFDSLPVARAYAVGLRMRHGWEVVDETLTGPSADDPGRSPKRSIVFVYERRRLWAVHLSPCPWGCRQPITECVNFGRAFQIASELSAKYADASGPLSVVHGEPS